MYEYCSGSSRKWAPLENYAKKAFITGAGHFKEEKIQSLYGSWVKWGFVMVAVSRASIVCQVLKLSSESLFVIYCPWN